MAWTSIVDDLLKDVRERTTPKARPPSTPVIGRVREAVQNLEARQFTQSQSIERTREGASSLDELRQRYREESARPERARGLVRFPEVFGASRRRKREEIAREPGFEEALRGGIGELVPQAIDVAEKGSAQQQYRDVRVEDFMDEASQQLRAETGIAPEGLARQRAYELAAAEAEKRSGQVGGVRLQERRNDDIGKAGRVIFGTGLPYRDVVVEKAGATLGDLAVKYGELSGVGQDPEQKEATREAARGATEIITPRTTGELALEVFPGVGDARGVWSFVREGGEAAALRLTTKEVLEVLAGGGDEAVMASRALKRTPEGRELIQQAVRDASGVHVPAKPSKFRRLLTALPRRGAEEAGKLGEEGIERNPVTPEDLIGGRTVDFPAPARDPGRLREYTAEEVALANRPTHESINQWHNLEYQIETVAARADELGLENDPPSLARLRLRQESALQDIMRRAGKGDAEAQTFIDTVLIGVSPASPADHLARILGSERGAVGAGGPTGRDLAVRAGATALGGGIGATQGDTPQERLRNALLGAGAGLGAGDIAIRSGLVDQGLRLGRVAGDELGAVGREAEDLPLDEPARQRVSQAIAHGVERQGPAFVHQEAIRSQERAQRFARVREIRFDPSLTPEERVIETKRALAGEYYRGEYTPMEIADSDINMAERMIRDSDLREGEWLGAMVGLSRLRSGQGLRNFEQELLGRVFGPEVLKAIKTRNTSLAANVARTWGVSAEDVFRAARAEELARPVGSVRQSALDSAEEVIGRRIDNEVGTALDRAVRSRIKAQTTRERQFVNNVTDEMARSTRQAVRETERYNRKRPTAEMLVELAKEIAPDKPSVAEAIRYWSEGNRALLDGTGDTRGMTQLARLIQTAFSGEVTDSYVARLAARQVYLQNALHALGLDEKDIKKIGGMMFDRELQLRYGDRATIPGRLPESVQRSIDMLKNPPLQGEKGSTVAMGMEFLASGSEEFKNLMFGIDLGVFGIQVRAATQGGFFPGIAGVINRTLTKMHAPHFADLYLETTLPRQIANMLDGVYYGRAPSAITERGYVMRTPGYGQLVDKLTQFQFGTVLGTVRDTLYEGNLLLLHVLRRDIKNPKTRARAAEWANMLTGFSDTAQTGLRKKAERAFFISPGMTRAQFGEILAASKLLGPTSSADQRILAALAIASYATTWLAAGKLIDDYLGTGEFEFDPSKPGAGTITLNLPGAPKTSIPFMANASLKRAIAQSIGVLAGTNDQEIEDVWARYLTAREATAARGVVGLTTGRGYTPEGRFTTDLSREDLMKSLIPAPPIVQSAVTEGLNPAALTLETFGVSNYPQSNFGKADEAIKAHNGDFRAALVATEGDTRDIVKYRWRQDLAPRLSEIGAYVIPGEPGRAPRIEFREWDEKEAEAVPRLIARLPEAQRPTGSYRTISQVRAAVIDHNLNVYMQRNNVGESEARATIGNNFDRLESVKNARKNEAIFRLNKWRERPELLDEAAAVDWEGLNEDERKILESVR